MTPERERLVRAVEKADEAELDAYFKLVEAQERHRHLDDAKNEARRRLTRWDAAHPEEAK